MTTPDMPPLPVVGYHGVNHDGYEVLDIKETKVLRMFDAGEVIAQPVCLLSDAQAYAAQLTAELEAARADATRWRMLSYIGSKVGCTAQTLYFYIINPEKLDYAAKLYNDHSAALSNTKEQRE